MIKKHKIAAFGIALLASFTAMAQQTGWSVSYKTLHVTTWNEAVRTYNFSRPFLSEKSPLLSHGVGISYLKTKPTSKGWERGWDWRLSYFQTSSSSTNLDLTIAATQLSLGHRFRLTEESEAGKRDFYLTPLLNIHGLARFHNGELIEIEEGEGSRRLLTGGFGLGGEMALRQSLWSFKTSNISLILGLQYEPVRWTYQPADIFNLSLTANEKNLSDAFTFRAGFQWSR